MIKLLFDCYIYDVCYLSLFEYIYRCYSSIKINVCFEQCTLKCHNSVQTHLSWWRQAAVDYTMSPMIWHCDYSIAIKTKVTRSRQTTRRHFQPDSHWFTLANLYMHLWLGKSNNWKWVFPFNTRGGTGPLCLPLFGGLLSMCCFFVFVLFSTGVHPFLFPCVGMKCLQPMFQIKKVGPLWCFDKKL